MPVQDGQHQRGDGSRDGTRPENAPCGEPQPNRPGNRWRLAGRRNLSQGKVFVEAFRRQPVDCARQQCNERAPGRIGPPRAAIEVHRDVTACAGVLEKAQVLLRRAKKHRHLVEWDAAFRFIVVVRAIRACHHSRPIVGGRRGKRRRQLCFLLLHLRRKAEGRCQNRCGKRICVFQHSVQFQCTRGRRL